MTFFKVFLVFVSLIFLTGLAGCADNNDPIAGDTGSVTENPVNGLTLTAPFQDTNTVFAFAAEEFVKVIHPAAKPMRGTFVQDGNQITIELGGFYINCSYDGTTFTLLGFEDKPGSYDFSPYSTFDHGGVQRYYYLYKPDTLPANAPLIFFSARLGRTYQYV